MPASHIKNVCVIGAGTMGSCIALSLAQQQLPVVLFDTNAAVVKKAAESILEILEAQHNKQRITAEQKTTIFNCISFSTEISDCVADVIIEAIIENASIKIELYKKLAAQNAATSIIASNTSSLSITALQAELPNPERFCGMHFFNPAHIMKLVEVIAGEQTNEDTLLTIHSLCIKLQKQPVMCKDAPGFIVNRVARHYYLEAMQTASKQNFSIAQIDALMQNQGFKMGPFALMDLIGLDVNYAVSKSVYEAFGNNPRFQPAQMQAEKVAAGNLGKKTGKGFYDYTNKP
jgi:3-hydroxybutyryl-CoA dehydrogenase